MNRENETIILSMDEFNVLLQIAKDHKCIDNLLNIGTTKIGKEVRVMFDVRQREDIRTALTESLARIGFDANYSPTKEGQILEDLIDKFFKE